MLKSDIVVDDNDTILLSIRDSCVEINPVNGQFRLMLQSESEQNPATLRGGVEVYSRRTQCEMVR